MKIGCFSNDYASLHILVKSANNSPSVWEVERAENDRIFRNWN